MNEDRRLIEDYLPIKAISKEASREKSVRKGHISTLHLWWARRPLVACRAAVYGALVPADQFRPKNGPPEKRNSLGRANAAKFLERLCKYPGNPSVIKEAQHHILEAHAERLTRETGKKVSLEDIEQGRAPRPKVLDMFAGGGAIPLEALRLGCEAYALDLNPVAHIIELCTLVYPQKYGKPDTNAKGMTGPENDKGETTWGGLADEVRFWGNWVLEKVREEIGDLYPPIPDPEYKDERPEIEFKKGHWVKNEKSTNTLEEWAGVNNGPPEGYLTPVAYLWTRTVKCKNPSCDGIVPLVRQTWLRKKRGRVVAMKVITPKKERKAKFRVVHSTNEKNFDFDPSRGSRGGNTACPFCGATIDSEYIKSEGVAKNIEQQMMAIACKRRGEQGKVYLSADNYLDFLPNENTINHRITRLCESSGLELPREELEGKLTDQLPAYGFNVFEDIFNRRQMLCLLTSVAAIKELKNKINITNHGKALFSYLSILTNRIVNQNNAFCIYHTGGEKIENSVGGHRLAMTWDYVEAAPFGKSSGGVDNALGWIINMIMAERNSGESAIVERGSATELPWPNEYMDAVITDPPYYDNVSYADLSDFFYVWMKRIIGDIYSDHFTSNLTPKKKEIIASTYRSNNKKVSRQFYENMMQKAFREGYRILKKKGTLICVYAHKTTLGWSTLIDALRNSGFMVVEAWPLNTELKAGMVKINKSALASSIFLVARKREEEDVRPIGSYEYSGEWVLQAQIL
ncbi:MAG: DUF1156 domain-containing protein [Deltaproteobacteria bacterium]|nr:DUF1156 domain-containing protein [Deltaproteobacteria bacterium]